MDLGIVSKVALVTAATRGLGRACAQVLVAEGARVAVAGRDLAALDRLVTELDNDSDSVMSVPMDLSDATQIRRAVGMVEDRWGPVEILVANAPGPPSGPVEEISIDQWRSAFDMNVLSMVELLHSVLPGMRRRNWGRIVFVTTIGVKTAQPQMVLSNATRLALLGLAKTLSLEVAECDILVNAVAPGPIATDRMDELIDQTAARGDISKEQALALWTDEVPLGRMGRPLDVASVVALLCSEACTFVTGAVIPVDGGKAHGY